MAAPKTQAKNPLALLRQLEWRVRHAVENILSGQYRSAFRGRGIEFDQVVRYEFGDDVRDIDWNVTARLGEPYRKKFVEEREVTLLLLIEDSPSLNFGSAGQSKREKLAVQPTSAPQENANPRTACGQEVMRFING